MRFRLLVTLTFQEPSNPQTIMTTSVVEFDTKGDAETAVESIEEFYPMSAIHATVCRLY